MDETNPYGTTPEQPNKGTSYLLNADAQAILEEAPNLEVGLDLLHSAYTEKNWDDPKAAAGIVSDYAQQLRYRFKENQRLSSQDTTTLAPIDMSEIKGAKDNTTGKIDVWEEKNKEFLDNTTDPDYILVKDKLKHNIETTASELRRGALGKDDNWLEDKMARFASGSVGGILKAVGLKKAAQNIEELTDPDTNDDFASALAEGGGTVGATIASAAAGGVIGAGAYLTGTAVGAIRESYQNSLQATGDKNRARTAAAIEGGSQAILTGVGGKIYAGTGRAIGKAVFGKPGIELAEGGLAHIAKKGAELGILGGLASAVSTSGQQYGAAEDQELKFTDIGKAIAVQAIFGMGSGGLDLLARKRSIGAAQSASKEDIPELGLPGDPPPTEVSATKGIRENTAEAGAKATNVINAERVTPSTDTTKARLDPNNPDASYDFVTGDGSRYTLPKTADGKLTGIATREDIESGEKHQPLDQIFFVKPEIAAKIAELRDQEDPSGAAVRILAAPAESGFNSGYRLLIKSGHVNSNFELQDNPTGARYIPVPTESGPAVGLVPIQANRPRNVNGNSRIYRSEIGKPITALATKAVEDPQSVGAAFDPSVESALGERLRTQSGVQSDIQNYYNLGTKADPYGALRYIEKPNAQSADIAEKFVAANGIDGAIDYIVRSPSNVVDAETVQIAQNIIGKFNDAATKAEAAGDNQAIAGMAIRLGQLTEALSAKKTNAAQATQIGVLLNKLNPEFHVAQVRQEVSRAAIEETASELGITPEDIVQTDHHINNIDADIQTAQGVIDTETQHLTKQFDPEIQETAKIITEIDKEAETKRQAHVTEQTQKATEIEAEAKVIEDEAAKRAETTTKDIDQGLEATKTQISEVESKVAKRVEEAKQTEEKVTQGVAEAQARIKVLETKGVKAKTDEIDQGLEAASKQVKQIESAVDKRVKEVEAKQSGFTEALDEANSQIKDIEAKGLKEAGKKLEGEITHAENVVEALKANEKKGAKVKPENIIKAEEGVKVLKEKKAKLSPEDGLSPADKAVLRKLKASVTKAEKTKPEKPTKESLITDAEKAKLDSLNKLLASGEEKKAKVKAENAEEGLSPEERASLRKLKASVEAVKTREKKTHTTESTITPAEKAKLDSLNKLLKSGEEKKAKLKTDALSPAEKAKIDKLRSIAQERKTSAAKVLKENFLSKQQAKDRAALVSKREELKNKKAEAQKNGVGSKSALAESQRKRIAELTAKKKALVERKGKIDKKVAEKVAGVSAQANKLKGLFAAAKATKGSTQQKLLKRAYELKDKLLKKDAPKANDALFTLFQANLLSDPSTQVVNITGNASQVIASTLSYAIMDAQHGGKEGLVFLDGVLEAMRGEGYEAFKAEMQGIKTFKPEIGKFHDTKESLSRPNEGHSDFVKTAPEWVKRIGLQNMGYIFRSLSGTDATFYRGLKEGQARLIAYNEGKALGVKDLRTYVAEKLFNSTEAWEAAYKQAEAEAKILAENDISHTPRETELRTWEILDEQRPATVREESHRFAQRGTFTNAPSGKIGSIIGAFAKFTQFKVPVGGKEIRPLRYLLPFMNAAGNILNANLDFTPIGLARAFDSSKSSLEKTNAMGKFILGTMATGIVYGLAREFMDDKNPYFAIYGAGPADVALKRQMQAEGWRPYSVKVGDSYIRYSETPLGIMFGFLGSWMDNQRFSPAYSRKEGSAAVAMVMAGMGGAFVDNSFLKNVSDLITGITKEEKIRNVVANTSRGFVPASGTLRAITKIFEDPIETYDDMWSKFVSGIPAVQEFGTKSALNVFGEPVERTFEDRVSFIGRFYSQRTTDPTWRWLAETGYSVPEQAGLTVKVSEKQNNRATISRAQKLGAAFAGVLTPEEAHQFVEKSGPQIKAVVDKYRGKYGQSAYREEVQKQLDREVSAVRSRVKQDMFLR